MFSQAFRQKLSNPTTITNTLQSQQMKSFSLNDSFTQYTKRTNEDTRSNQKLFNNTQSQIENTYIEPQTQQLQDLTRIVEQLQLFMAQKFQDIQTTLQEHENVLRPIQETNNQLQSLLVRSEKVLSQVNTTIEKYENSMKKNQKKQNDNNDQKTFQTIQNLLDKLDVRLNDLANDVDQIAQYNQKFQINLVEMVNQDKIENREHLHRVLYEMTQAKRSVSKKMRKSHN